MLVRPTSVRLVALLAFCCAACVLLFLSFGQYTKRTHVTGVLVAEGTAIKVTSPTPGVIVERRVREGQLIKAGDLLYILNAGGSPVTGDVAPGRDASSALDERRKKLASLVRQQQEAAANATDLDAEAQKLEKQISSQSQKLASQRTRMKQMRQAGSVGEDSLADPSLQQKLDEVLDMRAKLASTEKARDRAVKEAGQARTEAAHITKRIDTAKQELARAETNSGTAPAQTDADNSRRIFVTAPVSGMVASLGGEPGSAVNTQTLLLITPAQASMEAQLYAPVMAAGFVQPGQKLRIRYAGLAQGQHEGEVISISSTALAPEQIPESVARTVGAEAASGGLYRIRVSLNNQALKVSGRPLRLTSGMQVEADIFQDTRRLIEWVFAPRDGRQMDS